MSDKIEYSRLLLKRSNQAGVVPTVTTATTLNNFTETDLFDGEMFLNTEDEKAYVRMNQSIFEFDLVGSGSTDYNFCTTGIQTSAISGCSPVDIYDDFTFQSQKNIVSSNGAGKIELDFNGNANTTRIGSSGATFNDYLSIDPDFNFNGTELTSTDGTTDNFSSVFVQPNYSEISSQGNNFDYYSYVNTQISSGKFGDTATLAMVVEDNVASTSAGISLNTNFGGDAEITLNATNNVRISNPSLLFNESAEIQSQFTSQNCNIFTSTAGNTVSIGSSDGTVTISGRTNLNSGVSFDGGNTRWVFTEIQIGDWNMDTTASVNVAHSLSSSEWKTIRNISTTVRNDADSSYYELVNSGSGVEGGISGWNSTNIVLQRTGGGLFDSTDFDSTSYNRGFVSFWYKPD